MKPFVAVIAKGTSGKSTVIKSLTGCETSSFRGFLQDNLTGETILVICSSPQEQPISLAKVRELLKRAATDTNCRGVVMAIQPTRPRSRPSMEQIFEEAANFSVFQLHAFILDPKRSGESGNAEEVRVRLNKYGADITTLDGRRFASMNARIINDATGLVPVESAFPPRALATAAAGKKK